MILTLGKRASPIFFQYVTYSVFKEMVKQKYPPPPRDDAVDPIPPLTYEEENALHYVAGYVIRHLRKQIEKGSSPLKEGLLLCLEDMCNDDDEKKDCSASGTIKISRGHLVNVNGNSYRFFQATEMKVWQFLRVSKAKSFLARMKSQLVENVCRDEDVLFFWSILAAKWRREEEEVLLQQVAELWVTLREFSLQDPSWSSINRERRKHWRSQKH